MSDDIAQVYRSAATKRLLDELEEAGHIGEAVDGFRLAFAVACAFNCEPNVDPARRKDRNNWIATSGLDTNDGALRTVAMELYPNAAQTPYRAIEDLGEQGAKIIAQQMVGDDISFTDLLEKVTRVGTG